MTTVPPEALKGVRDLRLLMRVFDFQSFCLVAAYVACLWLQVVRGEQSSDPAVVVHALFTPSVFATLPFDSVIKMIVWLSCKTLGAGLHDCPYFLLKIIFLSYSLTRQPHEF